MRLLGKVVSLRAIFGVALLIAEAATAATNLPNADSNLIVLKDVTSIDKEVPSESAYDESTLSNVPPTPQEYPSSHSNVPPATEGHWSSNVRRELVLQTTRIAPMPTGGEPMQLKSKAALSSSLPPTEGALRSSPEASHPQSLSFIPDVSTLPTSKPDVSSTESTSAALEDQTLLPVQAGSSSSIPSSSSTASSNSAPEIMLTVNTDRESKADLHSVPQVPPIPGTHSEATDAWSTTFLSTPASQSPSRLQVQPESKAALHSVPKELTTPNLHVSLTEVQSQSKAHTSTSLKSSNASTLEAGAGSEFSHSSILPSRASVSLTSEGGLSTQSTSPPSGSPPPSPRNVISNRLGSTPTVFEEGDPSTVLRVQRTTPRPYARQAAPGGACQGDGRCVPLSYCRLLADLVERSCLINDRLQQLTCGYGNREPLVCCPPGGFASIWQTGPPPATLPPTLPPTSAPPPPPAPSPLPLKCGIPQVFNWRADYRGLGSQPWVARVGFKSVDSGAMQYPCCGSIISARVILTAAHCALAKTVGHKLSSVRVGEFDASQDPDCTAAFCAHKVQDVAVSHVVVHPAYDRATFANDIALLVLRQPLNFTLSTQPICLNGGGNYSPMPYNGYVGQRAKLVGWGLTAGQTDVPAIQQQLDLPVVPAEQCSRLYDEVVPITPQHLCVGGEPGRDACSGFGGAPLVMLDSATHTKYYQIAMVSFGSKQCGAPGVPSVYTRIDKYFEWIRANINY